LARNSSRIIDAGCLPGARFAQPDRASMTVRPPNQRLKLTARVD